MPNGERLSPVHWRVQAQMHDMLCITAFVWACTITAFLWATFMNNSFIKCFTGVLCWNFDKSSYHFQYLNMNAQVYMDGLRFDDLYFILSSLFAAGFAYSVRKYTEGYTSSMMVYCLDFLQRVMYGIRTVVWRTYVSCISDILLYLKHTVETI